MNNQTPNLEDEELRNTILKVATVKKSQVTFSQKTYSNNTVSPLEISSQDIIEIGIDDLMQLFHQYAAKHFVPKEEVEAVKRKTLVSIRKKFEGLGFSSELPEEFAKGLEAAQQVILDTLDTELAQLTNNQPNTPKGEE